MTRTPVLADASTRLTGDALTGRVLAAALALRERGVAPGDRVLVQGDNSVEYVIALLALMHLDASLVPLDHRDSAEGSRAAAEQAGVRWLLGDGTPVPFLPAERAIDRNGLGGEPVAGEVDLDTWLRRDDALVLWSSGTTGRPKGIVKSGRAVLDNTRRTVEAMGYREDDVLSPLLPFSHQYGLSVLLLWWLAGCTLLVTPYQRLDLAVTQTAAARATAVDASPSTYHALLGIVRHRPELRTALASVRLWGVGGAPLSPLLAQAFAETMGGPLLDGYGLTELGNVALATPDSTAGCGRPLPGLGLRIAHADGRRSVPGELGEIEVRSPGLMEGYLLADGSLTPVAPGSWFATGDLGRLDESGNLHVAGRNRAVHRLGFTLYPEHLERKAENCGRPVKVLAVDDPRRGASLHFVVADPDGDTPAAWRGRLTAHLADYEQPNAVHVVDRFPLTPNGKVDPHALRTLIGAPPA
uniref:class I adenylate-forming enzyme family protein n=1 Tax=Streptomyces sp. NRRL WC-3742 TaxID=1463934 RepID=UPI0004C8FE24